MNEMFTEEIKRRQRKLDRCRARELKSELAMREFLEEENRRINEFTERYSKISEDELSSGSDDEESKGEMREED